MVVVVALVDERKEIKTVKDWLRALSLVKIEVHFGCSTSSC